MGFPADYIVHWLSESIDHLTNGTIEIQSIQLMSYTSPAEKADVYPQSLSNFLKCTQNPIDQAFCIDSNHRILSTNLLKKSNLKSGDVITLGFTLNQQDKENYFKFELLLKMQNQCEAMDSYREHVSLTCNPHLYTMSKDYTIDSVRFKLPLIHLHKPIVLFRLLLNSSERRMLYVRILEGRREIYKDTLTAKINKTSSPLRIHIPDAKEYYTLELSDLDERRSYAAVYSVNLRYYLQEELCRKRFCMNELFHFREASKSNRCPKSEKVMRFLKNMEICLGKVSVNNDRSVLRYCVRLFIVDRTGLIHH